MEEKKKKARGRFTIKFVCVFVPDRRAKWRRGGTTGCMYACVRARAYEREIRARVVGDDGQHTRERGGCVSLEADLHNDGRGGAVEPTIFREAKKKKKKQGRKEGRKKGRGIDTSIIIFFPFSVPQTTFNSYVYYDTVKINGQTGRYEIQAPAGRYAYDGRQAQAASSIS